jgi:hypothetical protein
MSAQSSCILLKLRYDVDFSDHPTVRLTCHIQTLLSGPIGEDDQKLNSGCDDTDSLVLHRFFQTHADKIGKELLSQEHPTTQGRSGFASGKEAWEALCAKLVDMGSALEAPVLSRGDSSRHTPYQQFMHRNRDRDTDILNEVFYAHPAVEV